MWRVLFLALITLSSPSYAAEHLDISTRLRVVSDCSVVQKVGTVRGARFDFYRLGAATTLFFVPRTPEVSVAVLREEPAIWAVRTKKYYLVTNVYGDIFDAALVGYGGFNGRHDSGAAKNGDAPQDPVLAQVYWHGILAEILGRMDDILAECNVLR